MATSRRDLATATGTFGSLPCLRITPIVVPPALRLFSFFGQGVGFGPGGLVTGDAFFCQAL